MVGTVEGSGNDHQWFIVGRWQAYDAELRANWLRLAAIVLFYLIQLIHFFGFSEPTREEASFHTAATWIAAAWLAVGVAILVSLRRRTFPLWMKYLSTGADILLLTALASISVTKANGPIVYVYFLILAMAAMRFNLKLIWFATVGSLLGFWALIGVTDYPGWFDADHKVPVVHQLVVLASIALTGIILGQVVRRVRRLAEDYAKRVRSIEQESCN